MTPDDIAKLRALCEQATQPGPWTVNVNDIGKDGDGHCVVLDAHGMWVADCGNAPADAAFIAAARSALPQLLDECEALRREAERYAWATPAANVTRPAGCRCDLWPRGYCRDGCPSSDTTRLAARVAEQLHDWLNAEADIGDGPGKLRDFAAALRIVIDQCTKQRRRANWYICAYDAGRAKLVEHWQAQTAEAIAAFVMAEADERREIGLSYRAVELLAADIRSGAWRAAAAVREGSK